MSSNTTERIFNGSVRVPWTVALMLVALVAGGGGMTFLQGSSPPAGGVHAASRIEVQTLAERVGRLEVVSATVETRLSAIDEKLRDIAVKLDRVLERRGR